MLVSVSGCSALSTLSTLRARWFWNPTRLQWCYRYVVDSDVRWVTPEPHVTNAPERHS
jgi:hypothetical protein